MANEPEIKPPADWQTPRRPRSNTRRMLFILIGVLALAALAAWVWQSSGAGGPDDKNQSEVTQYQCPMHPEVIRDAPGSCPICGMDLVPMERDTTSEEPAEAAQYICPMHPSIVRQEPGSCPICGMDLVLKQKDQSSGEQSTVPGRATVSIDPEQRRRMGLRLGAVETRELTREVRTSARILIDETRQVRVTTKIEGWIGKLYVATTGQPVRQGEPLLTIYSPELVSAQEEYLSSLSTELQLTSANSDARAGGSRMAEAARRRLELWDITDEQIRRLEQTGHVEKYLTLYAPSGGWVIERMVLPGQKVMPSEPLLMIADLSRVWADADIYQSDLPHVQVGMPVELELPALPGTVLSGKVTFIAPTLDPETRTVHARIEIENTEMLLKPEMYATARLSHRLGKRLAVPVSGIMFTGTRTLAFRERSEHRLSPVEVQLGERSGDYYEVLSGLNEHDSVVVSANFLVDSESSLEAALAALAGGGTDSGLAPQDHTGH